MFITILLIPLGVLIIVKSVAIGNQIGEIGWCEKYIGSGGTYTFIKLFGLGLSIFAMMWLAGAPQAFLENIFGGLFGNK